MAPTLETLPAELLDAIGSLCCTSGDCSALRLTSRFIQSATRPAWTKAFFSRQRISLHVDSLNTLLKIFEVPDLAAALRSIDVCCEHDQDLLGGEPEVAASIPLMLEATPLLALLFQKAKNVNKFNFFNERDARHQLSVADRVSNFSITFSAVLFAAQNCGIKPTSIRSSSLHIGSDCLGPLGRMYLPRSGPCFSQLQELQLNILIDPRLLGVTVDGAEVGEQLANALNHMGNLKRLKLGFDLASQCRQLIERLASGITLPRLETVDFSYVDCFTDDLVRFIHTHGSTLKELILTCVYFCESRANETVFVALLEEIRDNLSLELLRLDDIEADDYRIRFHEYESYCKGQVEDGWVEIGCVQGAWLEGREEIEARIPGMITDCFE